VTSRGNAWAAPNVGSLMNRFPARVISRRQCECRCPSQNVGHERRSKFRLEGQDGQQHFRMRLTGDERSMGCGSGPVSAPTAVRRPQNTAQNHPCRVGFSRLAETFTELAQREAGCGSHCKWMSIAGSSSGDVLIASCSSWACTSSPQSVGGPQAGETAFYFPLPQGSESRSPGTRDTHHRGVFRRCR
jgi:hypothetical protein